MKNHLNFGNQLKKLRILHKYSLKQLSKLSGVQIATLSRRENDKAVGCLESYVKIAKAYGMKLSELFEEIEEC